MIGINNAECGGGIIWGPKQKLQIALSVCADLHHYIEMQEGMLTLKKIKYIKMHLVSHRQNKPEIYIMFKCLR